MDQQVNVTIKDILANQKNASKQQQLFQKLNSLLPNAESVCEESLYRLVDLYLIQVANKAPELQISAFQTLSECIKKGLFQNQTYLSLGYKVFDITLETVTNNVERQELWLKSFTVLIDMQQFHLNFYKNRSFESVELLNRVVVSGLSTPLKVNALKMLNTLLEVVDLSAREDVRDILVQLWIKQICPCIFDLSQTNLQSISITISYTMLVFLQTALQNDSRMVSNFAVILKQSYLPVMLDLVAKEDILYSKIWILLTKLLASKLHQGFEVNILLEIVEAAFKSQNIEVRMQAFYCWQILIESFLQNPNSNFNDKRIKLLSLPLKANNGRTENVVLLKFKTWCKFLNALHSKNVSITNHSILHHYLQFCFGPLTEQPLFSYFPGGASQIGQGKKFSGLYLNYCKAFLQLFAMNKYIHDELKPQLTYFTFECPNIKLERSHSKIIIDTVGECCVMLSHLTRTNGIEAGAIMDGLWKTLFDSIENLKDDEFKNNCCVSLSNVIQALIGVARKRTSLITLGLLPLFDIIVSNEFKFFGNEKMTDILFIPIVQTVVKKDKALLHPDVIEIFRKIFEFKNIDKEFLKFIQLVLNSFSTNLENASTEKIKMLEQIWMLLEEELKKSINNYNLNEISEENITLFNEFLVWSIITLNFSFDEEIALKWKDLFTLLMLKTSQTIQIKIAAQILKSLLKTAQNQSYDRIMAQIINFVIIQTKFDKYRKDTFTNIREILSVLKAFLLKDNVNIELYISTIKHIFSTCKEYPYCLLDQILDCITCLIASYKNTEILKDINQFIQSFKNASKYRNDFDKLIHILKTSGVDQSLLSSILTNHSTIINSIEKNSRIIKMFENSPASDSEMWKRNRKPKIIQAKEYPDIENSRRRPNILRSKKSDKIMSLLGHDIERLRGSLLQSGNENKSPSDEIIVNTPYKFDPKKLTRSQREKLAKRRDDIPALYQDLSQSQTQDFGDSNSQTTDTNPFSNLIESKNITEKSIIIGNKSFIKTNDSENPLKFKLKVNTTEPSSQKTDFQSILPEKHSKTTEKQLKTTEKQLETTERQLKTIEDDLTDFEATSETLETDEEQLKTTKVELVDLETLETQSSETIEEQLDTAEKLSETTDDLLAELEAQVSEEQFETDEKEIKTTGKPSETTEHQSKTAEKQLKTSVEDELSDLEAGKSISTEIHSKVTVKLSETIDNQLNTIETYSKTTTDESTDLEIKEISPEIQLETAEKQSDITEAQFKTAEKQLNITEEQLKTTGKQFVETIEKLSESIEDELTDSETKKSIPCEIQLETAEKSSEITEKQLDTTENQLKTTEKQLETAEKQLDLTEDELTDSKTKKISEKPSEITGKQLKSPEKHSKVAEDELSDSIPLKTAKKPIKTYEKQSKTINKHSKTPEKQLKSSKKLSKISEDEFSGFETKKSITPERSLKTAEKQLKTTDKQLKTIGKHSKIIDKNSKTPEKQLKLSKKLSKTSEDEFSGFETTEISLKTAEKQLKTIEKHSKTPEKQLKTNKKHSKTAEDVLNEIQSKKVEKPVKISDKQKKLKTYEKRSRRSKNEYYSDPTYPVKIKTPEKQLKTSARHSKSTDKQLRTFEKQFKATKDQLTILKSELKESESNVKPVKIKLNKPGRYSASDANLNSSENITNYSIEPQESEFIEMKKRADVLKFQLGIIKQLNTSGNESMIAESNQLKSTNNNFKINEPKLKKKEFKLKIKTSESKLNSSETKLNTSVNKLKTPKSKLEATEKSKTKTKSNWKLELIDSALDEIPLIERRRSGRPKRKYSSSETVDSIIEQVSSGLDVIETNSIEPFSDNTLNTAKIDINSADLNSENSEQSPEKRKRGRRKRQSSVCEARPAKIVKTRRQSLNINLTDNDYSINTSGNLNKNVQQRLDRELQRIKININNSEEFVNRQKRKTRASGSFQALIEPEEFELVTKKINLERLNKSPTKNQTQTNSDETESSSEFISNLIEPESAVSDTPTLNSEVLAEIQTENPELLNTEPNKNESIDFSCRKVLFDDTSENIPSSPVSQDTPTRNKELISNTSDLSPIKITSESEPGCSKQERIDNNSPHPLKLYTKKRATNRSAQMMDMISAQKITSPQKNKKPKEVKNVDAIFSPSQNRITKMMEQFEKGTEEDKSSEESEQIRDEDVLNFTRDLPNPTAQPLSSILKKRKLDDEPDQRPCKRRRVNFSDPPVSSQKYIEKNARQKFSASLKLDFMPHEPRITRSAKGIDENEMTEEEIIKNTLEQIIDNVSDDIISPTPEIPLKTYTDYSPDFILQSMPEELETCSEIPTQNEISVAKCTEIILDPISVDKSTEIIVELSSDKVQDSPRLSCEVSVITKTNESSAKTSDSLFSSSEIEGEKSILDEEVEVSGKIGDIFTQIIEKCKNTEKQFEQLMNLFLSQVDKTELLKLILKRENVKTVLDVLKNLYDDVPFEYLEVIPKELLKTDELTEESLQKLIATFESGEFRQLPEPVQNKFWRAVAKCFTTTDIIKILATVL